VIRRQGRSGRQRSPVAKVGRAFLEHVTGTDVRCLDGHEVDPGQVVPAPIEQATRLAQARAVQAFRIERALAKGGSFMRSGMYSASARSPSALRR
jgi:hypothetical protein